MTTFYDSYDYRQYWQGRQYADQAEKIALNKLLEQIPADSRNTLLDIGGGFGRLSHFFSPHFKTVRLIEPSAKLMQEAKKELKDYKNITFHRSKIKGIELEQAADVACLVRVAHHLNNLPEALEKINQLLTPGGYLILEFANKINFKARIRAFFLGEQQGLYTLASVDRRSPKNIRQGSIAFLNHHPEKITQLLEEAGFAVEEKLSVSNFRCPFLKKVMPLKIRLWLEKITQKPFACCNFGPSIFFLARKD